MAIFSFAIRQRDLLVCSGVGGAFALNYPIGEQTVYLPNESAWKEKAPEWARGFWFELRVELQAWCAANESSYEVDPAAKVRAAPL